MRLLLGLLSLASLPATAHANEFVVKTLSGGQQISGEPPAINSNANGTVTFVYSNYTESIVWALEISNPTRLGIFGGGGGAFIKCKSNSSFQIPLITLVPPGSTNNSTEIGVSGEFNENDFPDDVGKQCVATIPNLWTTIKSRDSLVFVNVDSKENPPTEIRADMSDRSDIPGDAEGEVIEGSLSGDQQSPAVVSTAMGDITFVYSAASSFIVFVLSITNPDGLGIFGPPGAENSTGALISCVGDNPQRPVVQLVPGGSNNSSEIGVTGKITDSDILNGLCVDDVRGIWSFLRTTTMFVNVASDEHPSGEIRAKGPLTKYVLPTQMPSSAPSSVPTYENQTAVPSQSPSGSPSDDSSDPTAPTSASPLIGGVFSWISAAGLLTSGLLFGF